MSSNYVAITEYNERQLGLDTASRKTQISMYSDPTHFIFEILQNADDYGATEIFFRLSKSELIIEHNGKPFKKENVKAITYFGKSTSAVDLVKTGRFGVGFKSVFAFTATPIVISGDEHFQIYGLYRIKEHPFPDGLPRSRTRIVLPFNHESEQPDFVDELITQDDAYARISGRLVGLNLDTLLFTQNIREIRWEVEDQSGHYLREDKIDEGVRHTTIADSGERLNEYLVFSQVPLWKDQKHKAVEIAFTLDKKGQIVPSEDDYLYVLFATTQEPHLQFILNGPYRTNPSRETISEEDSFNKHLMTETCLLIKNILPQLRDKGLLTTQFLSVLPNNNDKLRDFYVPLIDAIIETFHELELVPTDENQHSRAENVLLSPAVLREVITKIELPFFVGNDTVCWAKGVQQNSRADYFLQSLGIQRWGWKQLEEKLSDKFGHYFLHSVDDDNDDKAWLASRSDSWLQKLYILLANSIKKEDCSEFAIKRCRIIRVLENGKETHVTGSLTYFPKRGYRSTPQVKTAILRGKNQKTTEEIQASLIALGVSEIGDEERVDVLLETFYTGQTPKVTTKQHLQHISTFIKWWQKEKSATKFNDYAIFYSSSDSNYYKPRDCFLDLPFEDSGLNALFVCQEIPLEKRKRLVWKKYNNVEGFHDFAKAAGVMNTLEIREYQATKLQNRIFCISGSVTNTTVDKDYFINGLKHKGLQYWHAKGSKGYLGNLDLSIHRVELSLAVWKTLCRTNNECFWAFYRPNQKLRYKEKQAPSYLINQLQSCDWVPNKSGAFCFPKELTRELLHPDFPTDNIAFLNAIGFGENEQKETEEYKSKQRAAEGLGITLEAAELTKELLANPEIYADVQRRLEQSKISSEFPEKKPKNPERRKRKVKEQIKDAPKKEFEKKEQNVRTSKGEAGARTYLRELYTNSSDEPLFCQLCHDPMPFKKRNGEYYMEAVEIAGCFTKEIKQLYLALCPNCSAKYRYFIKKDDKIQQQVIAELLQTDSVSILLSLGETNASLRFVETHLADVKTILEELDADHD